jgi:hypothetical protein
VADYVTIKIAVVTTMDASIWDIFIPENKKTKLAVRLGGGQYRGIVQIIDHELQIKSAIPGILHVL